MDVESATTAKPTNAAEKGPWKCGRLIASSFLTSATGVSENKPVASGAWMRKNFSTPRAATEVCERHRQRRSPPKYRRKPAASETVRERSARGFSVVIDEEVRPFL